MKEYHKIQTLFHRDPATNHKTLLEGVWSMPEFEVLKDIEWLFTEKVDGTNIRVHWDGERVLFGGKTDNAQIPARLVAHLGEAFPAELFRSRDMPAGLTLYGEGFGATIQKGGGNYRPNRVDFIMFDAYCGMWLERPNVEDIASKLGCGVVPILWAGTLESGINICRNGFQSAVAEVRIQSEGWVARPRVELMTRRGERIITKLKCKDFAVLAPTVGGSGDGEVGNG